MPCQMLSASPCGLRTLDNLAHDVGQKLVVVGAVDAREIKLAAAVRLAIGVDGEPVRVGAVEGLVGLAGIHPRDDRNALFMGGGGELAVKIAVTELRRAVVERELGGIVSEYSAGVDDDGLNLGALPVLPPPGDVVVGAVGFGDVGLPEAIGALVPGNRFGGGAIGGSTGGRLLRGSGGGR